MLSTTVASSNAEWARRDLSVVWHPCTQMKDHEQVPMIPIRRAQGVWLEDYDGKRYLDAVSAWWVNLFGHAHPHINARIKEQLDTLPHVMLAGFTHAPAVTLAERLLQLAPPGLTRCFYADNGSSAVEVELKMSYHYWRNRGCHGKHKFVTFNNGYHGETLGALAVGDVPLYKQTYQPLLMETITVASPDLYLREPGETPEAYTLRRIEALRAALTRHAHEVAAVIIEPLVQCAGFMRMHEPLYLTLLRRACDEFNVHLIADEIAVGFGRTGTLFACEQAGIRPDLMCLSKGLTGGYLPLAAVLTTEALYEAFYDDDSNLTAFLHSHSYTGNALGCSAALATLELFEHTPVLAQNAELAHAMAQATAHFAEHPHVAEVRQRGMILAVELVSDKPSRTPFPWQQRRGLRVAQHALRQGVLLRPLGNVVYFMPPYVIMEDEIRQMADAAWQGIIAACAD